MLNWFLQLLATLGLEVVPIHPKPKSAYLFIKPPVTMIIRGNKMQIPVGSPDVVHVNVFDAQGDVITLVSPPPVWSTSDPTVATVTPAADGMSATITPVKVGSVTINCQVTPSVAAQGAVDVVAGIPASATLTFDIPGVVPMQAKKVP